jgi:hypothetical protein
MATLPAGSNATIALQAGEFLTLSGAGTAQPVPLAQSAPHLRVIAAAPQIVGPFGTARNVFVTADTSGPGVTYFTRSTGDVPAISTAAQQAAGAIASVQYTTLDRAVNPDGSATVSPVANPLRYTKWRTAVSKVRDGSANALLLYLGDSTTLGSGAAGGTGYNAGGRAHNRAVRLAAALTKAYLPAFAHGTIGSSNVALATYQPFDPRWTYGAGWGPTALQGTLGKTQFFNNTTVNALSVAPVGNVDTFRVLYSIAASQGTFSWDVDGGAATNIGPNNGATALGMSGALAAGSLGAHTLNIKRVSGNVTIHGFRAYDSTTPQIEIMQCGCSGAVVADYAAQVLAYDGLLALQNVLKPDLVIFSMGINDWVAGTDLATFKANVTLLLQACQVNGDVLLVTPPPSQITTTPLVQQQRYVDALIGCAAAAGVEYLDLWRRFVSYELAQPLGLMVDNLHPSGTGYADWAQAESNKIMSI